MSSACTRPYKHFFFFFRPAHGLTRNSYNSSFGLRTALQLFFSCYLGLAIQYWLKRHDNEEPCFWNSPWHTRRIEVISEVTQQLADRQPKVLAKGGNAPWNSWWLTLYFLIWEQFVVHTCGRCCDCPTILHLPTHLHIAIARPSPRHLTLILCMCYAEYDYNSSTT